jgi:GTP-binding protein EngB required for normal cell division
MGYDFDNSKVLKICVIGGSEEIINKIFPNNLGIQKDIQCKKRNLYKDIEAKDYNTGKSAKYKVNWEAYIFPDLTDDNDESIMDTISYKIFNFPNEEQNIQNNQQNISKNNIIIKFGSNNTDFLLDYIDSFFSKLFIPQIAIITNEEIKGNQNNRFLTIIKEKMHSELYKDIFSYLWERECYFNQRGHLMNEYAPKSHDKIKDLPCSSLNILLTGISRSGKSTFINILSKKLISLETPECLSITREINEFVIYKEVEGQGLIKLKLIDTPGLTIIPEEKKDTTDDVINSIDKKLKEFDDSNESIHIIYFFMIGVTNLEQSKKFFKYLSDLQKERIKKIFLSFPYYLFLIVFVIKRILMH